MSVSGCTKRIRFLVSQPTLLLNVCVGPIALFSLSHTKTFASCWPEQEYSSCSYHFQRKQNILNAQAPQQHSSPPGEIQTMGGLVEYGSGHHLS